MVQTTKLAVYYNYFLKKKKKKVFNGLSHMCAYFGFAQMKFGLAGFWTWAHLIGGVGYANKLKGCWQLSLILLMIKIKNKIIKKRKKEI